MHTSINSWKKAVIDREAELLSNLLKENDIHYNELDIKRIKVGIRLDLEYSLQCDIPEDKLDDVADIPIEEALQFVLYYHDNFEGFIKHDGFPSYKMSPEKSPFLFTSREAEVRGAGVYWNPGDGTRYELYMIPSVQNKTLVFNRVDKYAQTRYYSKSFSASTILPPDAAQVTLENAIVPEGFVPLDLYSEERVEPSEEDILRFKEEIVKKNLLTAEEADLFMRAGKNRFIIDADFSPDSPTSTIITGLSLGMLLYSMFQSFYHIVNR
ncbi:MAG: hypothetical protein HGA85_02265 [Nanoarchaeota archaeon]|nr:hypothetical protein [Nanoarchaeota archaeon]